MLFVGNRILGMEKIKKITGCDPVKTSEPAELVASPYYKQHSSQSVVFQRDGLVKKEVF